MDVVTRKKLLIVTAVVMAALALPLALAATGGWSMWKDWRDRKEMESAHRDAMQAALERAADVAMPVPRLTGEEVYRDIPVAEFEQELQRIVRLANGVGGSSASWNDGKSVRIVANVPQTAEDLFRQSLERGVYDIAAAGESKLMTVVQVVLRPVEPPLSPSQKK
jgi:hypothetical protein